MSLQKLARELDETARQTAAMVEGITYALEVLADPHLDRAAAQKEAVAMIVNALQGQDRIEQRCQNMALAVRQFALLPVTAPDSDYDEIWANLVLDELRVPALSGVAATPSQGEVDLF
jgi:microcystin degradation protein MlrC